MQLPYIVVSLFIYLFILFNVLLITRLANTMATFHYDQHELGLNSQRVHGRENVTVKSQNAQRH